jgi:hypothetical protein
MSEIKEQINKSKGDYYIAINDIKIARQA